MENSIFKKEFVYIAILGGWLWGCGSGNDRAAFSEQGGKEIILENISTVPLRERIDSVWCVPLETTDSSLVSSVASLQIMDDRFYMLDGTYASILIFDKQGRYINGIYGQGKGPKEYIRSSPEDRNSIRSFWIGTTGSCWSGLRSEIRRCGNFTKRRSPD